MPSSPAYNGSDLLQYKIDRIVFSMEILCQTNACNFLKFPLLFTLSIILFKNPPPCYINYFYILAYLSSSKLETIEERLESINSMTNIGRVPSHISGNYGVFSAAEWKNWTITYSLFCLCGILPENHYRFWEKFVLACRI